jgi:hypothetical protein
MQSGRRAEVALAERSAIALYGAPLLAQISTRNLNVAIVGQLPATDLPLCDPFQSSPMQMVGFEASFGRRRFIKQALKDTPGNPDDALILADPDAELDG